MEYIFEYFCHVHPVENNFNGILLFTMFDGKEHTYDVALMPSQCNEFLNVSRLFFPRNYNYYRNVRIIDVTNDHGISYCFLGMISGALKTYTTRKTRTLKVPSALAMFSNS